MGGTAGENDDDSHVTATAPSSAQPEDDPGRCHHLSGCVAGMEDEPGGHCGLWAVEGCGAGWMPAKGLGRMQARKAREEARVPSIRIRPERAASA